MRETPTIFDLVFKRLLDLSDKALVYFINGIFDEEYSPESKVGRLHTEYISKDLRKKLLDVLLSINEEVLCHIEAQIDDDEDMVIRMFEYGYAVALRSKKSVGNVTQMKFPKARVIYWETTPKTPDEELLRLEFPDGTTHDYVVDSFKLLDYSIEELEQKKLAVLLPFYVLKLRKRVKVAKTREERQALAEEMQGLLDKLIEALEREEQFGIITESDMRDLLQYAGKLVEQVYKQKYDEFKEVDHMLEERLLTYSEEAEIRGLEKGRKEGLEKGREEGREKGREEGREKGREEVAKELLAEGMDSRMVARVTKLPEDTVAKINAELRK